MTPYERKLAELLKAAAPRVVTKEEILAGLYPDGNEPGAAIIKVFIRHIRKAFGDASIATVWGRGYQWKGTQCQSS